MEGLDRVLRARPRRKPGQGPDEDRSGDDLIPYRKMQADAAPIPPISPEIPRERLPLRRSSPSSPRIGEQGRTRTALGPGPPGGLQAALEKNRSFQGPVAALGGLQDRRVILRPDRISDSVQASGIGRAEREEIRDDQAASPPSPRPPLAPLDRRVVGRLVGGGGLSRRCRVSWSHTRQRA